jgi:hypothetical protein
VDKTGDNLAKHDPLTQFNVFDFHQFLDYNSQTGVFRWKPRPDNPCFNTQFADQIAGTINPKKYRIICIKGVSLRASRIAYKMMTGDDPPDQMDHRDRNRDNNRWKNLRPATNQENRRNQKIRADNQSHATGVYWNTAQKVWRARIDEDGKRRHLGSFKLLADAVVARRQAEQEMFGAFAPAVTALGMASQRRQMGGINPNRMA